MPFVKEPTKTPARISRVTMAVAVLKAPDATVSYDSKLSVQVELSDGTSRERVFPDLNAELTAPQRTTIKNFIDGLLLRAEQEIL